MTNKNNKNLYMKIKIASIVGIVVLFASFAFIKPNEKKVFVIDTGYAVNSFTNKTDESVEKNIISGIIDPLKKISTSNNNMEIVFITEADQVKKAEIINNLKPILVLSINVNNSSNTANKGASVNISNERRFNKESKKYAISLLEILNEETLTGNTINEINLENSKNLKCPSLNLQIGYLSNKEDREFILSQSNQSYISGAIFNFLVESSYK